MSPEPDRREVGTVHPVVEKLIGLFSWEETLGPEGGRQVRSQEAARRLNTQEELQAEYHDYTVSGQKRIICRGLRNEELVFSLHFSEDGLESLGFGDLELSFVGSPRIKLGGQLGIGHEASLLDFHIRSEDWKEFRELATPVVAWVEDIIFKGEIGTIPLSLMKQPRSNPDR